MGASSPRSWCAAPSSGIDWPTGGTLLPSLLSGLGAVALFLAAGWGLTAGAADLRALPWPRRRGYSYLLGVAAIGVALYAGSHLAGLPLRRWTIFPLALALAALALLPRLADRRAATVRRTARPALPPPSKPWRTPHGALRLGCA